MIYGSTGIKSNVWILEMSYYALYTGAPRISASFKYADRVFGTHDGRYYDLNIY